MHLFLFSLCIASVALAALPPTTFALSSRKFDNSRRNVRKRALNQSSIPLLDYFDRCDLQWFGPVQVGTPPQNFTVVFDTGSDTFEIPGKNCTTDCPNQNKFDWDKSSTYKFTDNGDGQFIQFATGVGVDPVDDDHEWTMTMFQASDTVSVGGLTATNVSFFLIDHQTPTFAPDPFDGIMGLFTEAGSFMKGLIDQGLPPMLGFYFARNATGELTLGGIDSSKFNSTMIYATIKPNQGGPWVLNASHIWVNGQSAVTELTDIIFDSGTSNAVFPKNITEAIYMLISPDIKPYTAEPGTYGIECSKIDSLKAVIDLSFTSVSGEPFNLTLPSKELNLGPFRSNTSLCQTLINAWTIDFPPVIGGSLMKNYYTAWDIGNSSLGFAALSVDESSAGTGDQQQHNSSGSKLSISAPWMLVLAFIITRWA